MKKKILIITPTVPWPVKSGGNAAQYHLLNYFREIFDITILVTVGYNQHDDLIKLRELWKNVTLITVDVTYKPSLTSKLLSEVKIALGKLSYLKKFYHFLIQKEAVDSNTRGVFLYSGDTLSDYLCTRIINVLSDLLKKEKYDLIQVEFTEYLPIVASLPKDTPKIFVQHEIRYIRMQREQAVLKTSSPLENFKIEYTKIRELSLLKRYDKVLTLTAVDKSFLEKELLTNVEVSPFSVGNPKNSNKDFSFSKRFTFIGAESHFPNKDAVYWFINEIWNKFNNKDHFTFSVIGFWSKEAEKTLKQSPNIEFKGFVDDLESEIKGTIMVVPIRIGSGVRTKILDAALNMIPVIATSVGLEGLPLKHGSEVLIADSPEEFMNCLNLLSTNKDLQKKLVHNAYEIISKEYSVERCVEIREAIYNKCLQ